MATKDITHYDPFDDVLSLEDGFYKAGYELGAADGELAGRVEGRSVGLKAGFEKYVAMGKLNGRATVWAGRLPAQVNNTRTVDSAQDGITYQGNSCTLSTLPANRRLQLHVKTLYALTEPESLSTANSEESVGDFGDRLKRAEAKAKIIEKVIGEIKLSSETSGKDGQQLEITPTKDASIEDASVLHRRH
ncbi:MAG: hypothetical protein Q9163_002277 [Psora crenata]